MQRLEVSCAVRLIYTSLGGKGLNSGYYDLGLSLFIQKNPGISLFRAVRSMVCKLKHLFCQLRRNKVLDHIKVKIVPFSVRLRKGRRVGVQTERRVKWKLDSTLSENLIPIYTHKIQQIYMSISV